MIFWEDILKLLLAMGMGGAIGLERELRDKSAGLRTLMFICAGSALFTIFSIRMAGTVNDPARIAANIVTGIGFLGAGAILRDGGQIRGLTTASAIWVVAALGLGIGAGNFLFCLLATVIFLIALWLFAQVEVFIGRARVVRTYNITFPTNSTKFIEIEDDFKKEKLTVIKTSMQKRQDSMTMSYEVIGPAARHSLIVEHLIEDDEINEVRFN